MLIVYLYAALLALLFVYLSVRTIRTRRRLEIAVGDADDIEMLRAMRVQQNFAEYVPLSLILLYFMEQQGAHPVLMHALGLCLLIGRGCHAFGVSNVRENFTFRVYGMSMTFAVLIIAAVYLLASFAWTWH